MLQGGYKCLLRSKFWEVLSLFIFIHERHKYQLKKQKKLCRTSCWNVPGHLIRTSPDVLCERPESKCYGESLEFPPLPLREAPRKIYICSFGHCPNSHWTPPPLSNGHSVAPIVGQNHANARLYMLNRCHKPSWQGFRPTHPNGQCPNEQRYFYVGASLRRTRILKTENDSSRGFNW